MVFSKFYFSGLRIIKKIFLDNNVKNSSATESEELDYIGWIPNTGGQAYLRYRIANPRHDIDFYVAQPPVFSEIVSGKRSYKHYILGTSLRDLNSFAPDKESAKLTRFIVDAVSVNLHELRGDLWMIWDKNNNPSESEFEQKIIALFGRLEKQSEKLRNLLFEFADVAGNEVVLDISELKSSYQLREAILDFEKDKYTLGKLIYPINSEAKEESCYVFRFKFVVSNAGFCYLKDYRPSISEEAKGEEEISSEIRLAYDYLRYFLNPHEHHDRKLGGFGHLQKIPKKHGKLNDKSIKLAEKLLRDVKINLIQLNQAKSVAFTHASNTSRITAYAISLIQRLKAEKILHIDNPEHVDFVERESAEIGDLIKSIDMNQQRSFSEWVNTLSTIFLLVTTITGSTLVLFGVEVAKLMKSQDSVICSNNKVHHADFIGNHITNLVCEGGITYVFLFYTVFIFCVAMYVYWLFYYKNNSTSSSLSDFTLRILCPSKITMPFSSSSDDEELNLIALKDNSLHRKLKSAWYKFGCFRIYNLPPFMSGTSYQVVTYKRNRRGIILLIIFITLFILSIYLAGVGAWTIFTFNENEIVEEVFGNKLFDVFLENLRTNKF